DQQEAGEQFEIHRPVAIDIPHRFAGERKNYASPFSSPIRRSTETTCSFSAVENTMTPCVERPAMRMPLTGQRINCPPSVTSMIWSASSIGNEATMRPVLGVSDIATIPLPPRPVVRYSKDEERLPKPRSEMVSTNC